MLPAVSCFSSGAARQSKAADRDYKEEHSMKARLRTLVVLLIMSVCLMGDVVIPAQAQTYWPGQYQTARRRAYRQRLAARRLAHRRQTTSRRLRQRQRMTIFNQQRRRSLYNRRRHPRAWAVWARRHRRGRVVNWRNTDQRERSDWARRHRRNGRGRNWTPGIPRGRRWGRDNDSHRGRRHGRDRD